MKKLIPFIVIALAALQSCSKSSEDFKTVSLDTYSPLVVGKYITYNLDSLVFLPFGGSSVIRNYQVKYSVDGTLTDNLGRPAYRIIRYIRKTPANPWVPDASFMTVNTGNSIEFTENNMRYIKLKAPIQEGYSWKGNAYIDTYSLNSEVKYMDGWDYTYEDVHQPKTVGSFHLDSTLVVNQREDSLGAPVTPQTQYAEKNISKEIYAKGIGLVFRDFLHWEFQRVSTSYTGYGVTYTMIDHN